METRCEGTDNINNDKGIDDISKGKGTDDINKDKDGILLFSVSSRVNIMRLLLIQNESDVNAKKTVDTLLHTAAKNGHMDSVELLVDERGADVNNEDGFFSTALHHASKNGHLDVVNTLIDRGAKVNFKQRRTPLDCASENGHLHCVNKLIDRGAEVNYRTKNRRTPLHCASYSGNLNIVNVLIDSGADVNSTTRFIRLLAVSEKTHSPSLRGRDGSLTNCE
eukprot:GHVR01035148.1.p1 GENE.GHVR01035148.1~~GHVR01035148.1.p1  ORF type:complete len:240 (-),score=54.91 GHVR01035148.1:357-1022(-)